jgi:hypothetical protein
MYMDLEMFNFSLKKLHVLPFILYYEPNSGHVNLLISTGDGYICFVIIILSNSCSHFLVVIFHFATFLTRPNFHH